MREELDRVTTAHNALARAYALDGEIEAAAMELVLVEQYGEPELESPAVIGHVPEPLAGRDYTALRDEVAAAHVALAAEYERRENWPRAVEEARAAVDYDPGRRAAWEAAGRAHAALGAQAEALGDRDTARVHWRGAAAAWHHVIALVETPSADALLALADAESEAGDIVAAFDHYRAALEVRPDDARAIQGIGLLMEDWARLSQAVHGLGPL